MYVAMSPLGDGNGVRGQRRSQGGREGLDILHMYVHKESDDGSGRVRHSLLRITIYHYLLLIFSIISHPLHTVLRTLIAVSLMMLKFWNPADLTPRAGPNGQERKNPFDLMPNVQAQQQPVSTPPTQPPPSYRHQLLSTPQHILSPALPGGPAQPAVNSPEPVSQSGPLTPSATPLPSALPTIGLTLHAPNFNMQQPPPPKRQQSKQPGSAGSSSSSGSSAPVATRRNTNASIANGASSSMQPSGPSKGQIHVKLIQARGLNVRSSLSRPYVVVQFEQNEFVSREPTDEGDKEVKGIPTLSRNPSSTALATLNSLNHKANGKQANGESARSSKQPTPSSSLGSGKSQLSAMFGSRISAHNPVWKHEVSL